MESHLGAWVRASVPAPELTGRQGQRHPPHRQPVRTASRGHNQRGGHRVPGPDQGVGTPSAAPCAFVVAFVVAAAVPHRSPRLRGPRAARAFARARSTSPAASTRRCTSWSSNASLARSTLLPFKRRGSVPTPTCRSEATRSFAHQGKMRAKVEVLLPWSRCTWPPM